MALVHAFNAMFDCPVSHAFPIGRTKVSYLLSDAIGPCMQREMVRDVNRSKSSFKLHFDEMTNIKVDKQMDFYIRY